jgi:nucleoside-diphosphate-sugar epimerase
MKVLVTGAAGFVGQEVVRHLSIDGQEAVAVARSSEQLSRIPGESAKVWRVAADLDDANVVGDLLCKTAPDALIHLAWYADPCDYLTSHRNLASIRMTTALVDATLAAGCRKLVLVGSCAEYAHQDRPVVESDPVDVRTLYAACKHSACHIARVMAAEADAELAWARIFHVHGPGENERRLIPWVAGQIRAGIPVSLTDGTQVRDHLHVSDVAAGLVAMLAPGATGIYNVCSGQPIKLRSVLETVGDIVGRSDLLEFGARPHSPNEAMYLAGNPARLRSLGWAPRFGLRDGLIDALSIRRPSLPSSPSPRHQIDARDRRGLGVDGALGGAQEVRDGGAGQRAV